jgi:uncharacterized protein Yka (UPF0111/DUF47 family)
MKSRIVEHLGQADILLPALIADGLAANDRIKVRLSILQAAARRAREPAGPLADFAAECRTTGLDPSVVRSLVTGARLTANGAMLAPGLATQKEGIFGDVQAMIQAVEAGTPAEGQAAAQRLSSLLPPGSLGPGDEIDIGRISQLTSVAETGADSLHRLVMDLHKALNRLAAGCAEEVVSGAHAYGLGPDDRPIVTAFMRGIERTKSLKFDHPGLAATAIRSGSRLTLQNDIGTTDAHVVIIAVDADAVTLTYTDVHRARAKFFADLLDGFPADWSGLDHRKAEGLGEDDAFFLITARLQSGDGEQRKAFLEAIGAALVFLIDWNKARKVLRLWVNKADSIRILDWAARNHIGHRAFLELGGSDLVAAAVRHATPTRIGFGERLDTALGRDSAIDFLKTVLRISTEALMQGRSVRLARDRIEADLVRRLERVDSALLAIVVRQAGLAREIAAAIDRHIAEQQSGRQVVGTMLAARARRTEEKADRIAIEARNEIARFEADPVIEQMVDRVEEAIDELEQAAFIASLMPASAGAELTTPLTELCSAATSAAEAAASGVDAAAEVPEGRRADSEDALACVSRLIDLEHVADAAEREVTTAVLSGSIDLRTSLSALELARAIERATDRLAGFGHLLRRHVLADLSTT